MWAGWALQELVGGWRGSDAGERLGCQIERVVNAEVVSLGAGIEDDGARDRSGRRWSSHPDNASFSGEGVTQGLALGGSGVEGVTSEVEEGGALSSMAAHGGGVLRFLSRERRESLDRERCEEGEKGADERQGWSVS